MDPREKALQLLGGVNISSRARLLEVRRDYPNNECLSSMSDAEIVEELMQSSQTAVLSKMVSLFRDEELAEAREATREWLEALSVSCVTAANVIKLYDDLLNDH